MRSIPAIVAFVEGMDFIFEIAGNSKIFQLQQGNTTMFVISSPGAFQQLSCSIALILRPFLINSLLFSLWKKVPVWSAPGT
jgi:hypothetical protein